MSEMFKDWARLQISIKVEKHHRHTMREHKKAHKQSALDGHKSQQPQAEDPFSDPPTRGRDHKTNGNTEEMSCWEYDDEGYLQKRSDQEETVPFPAKTWP